MVLVQAKRKEVLTYLKSIQGFAPAPGGRWSKDARICLIQRRVEQAWRLRWYSILSCVVVRALRVQMGTGCR